MGALVATFPLGALIGYALAGQTAKRSRSTPLLLISLTLVALGSAGFVAGRGLIVYFASRFVMGIGSGGL